MLRISEDQRRARLGVRHHLAAGAHDIVSVSGDLVGLHATDPATVFLAARARVGGFTPAAMERALYDDRLLAKILGMRRTMFVVPAALVPVLHGAVTRGLAARERTRTLKMIAEAGIADDPDVWLRDVEAAALSALEARGQATARELSADVPALAGKIAVGQGTKWEGTIGVSTRVLFLLANEARVIRGRPLGTWLSSQYRWAPLSAWLATDVDALPTGEARQELARRWLRTFGPATVGDLKWWAGWTLGETRTTVAALDTVEVDLDGDTGIVLADDVDPLDAPPPWTALLPALDPTVMGWAAREWYLGPHRPALFDRNGNAGPTVWCDGRIVGGWAQRPEGDVVVRLLEDVGAEARRRIAGQAADLTQWLGDVRIIPRFRTPLERELSA